MREAIRFNRTRDLIRNGIGRWDHAPSLDLVYLPPDPGRRPCDCGLSDLTVFSRLNNLITDNSSERSSDVHVSAICLLQDSEIARSAHEQRNEYGPLQSYLHKLFFVFLLGVHSCFCLKRGTFLRLWERWTPILVKRVQLVTSSLAYCSLTYQLCLIPISPSTHPTYLNTQMAIFNVQNGKGVIKTNSTRAENVCFIRFSRIA